MKAVALDKIVSVTSVVFPFTTFPQIWEIWYHGNAQGISLLTWFLYIVFTIPLLLHSINQKDKKLSMMFSLWIFIYVVVVSGVIVVSNSSPMSFVSG